MQEYKKRTTLLDWVEKASAWYEKQLKRPAGKEAREYLKSRGFGEEAWDRHRMGFAPDGWRNLADELMKQGATLDELVEAGLVVRPEDEEAGEEKKLFRITLPLGMQIPQGTRLLLDKEQPMTGTYVVCLPNGCMADFDVNPEFVGKLKKGQQLVLQGINLPGQAATYMLPLTDFAKANAEGNVQALASVRLFSPSCRIGCSECARALSAFFCKAVMWSMARV